MRFLRVLTIAVLVIAAGCSSDQGKSLIETARFEEKQNNREHAIQLYEVVARKYPGTESGKFAEKRLKELKTLQK